jgi:hypothetical protein
MSLPYCCAVAGSRAVRPGRLPVEAVETVVVSDRRVFALHMNSAVAAYPFGEHFAGSAPLWQTAPVSNDRDDGTDLFDDGLGADGAATAVPRRIAVCGGDWLIIGYDNATMGAVDVRGPPSEWKVNTSIALSALDLKTNESLYELTASTDGHCR